MMMGDALAAKYGARFGGAVLWSPALDAQAPPALLLCLLRAVCSVWPSAQLGPPEDPYASFAELTEAQKYDECPHNYKGMGPVWLAWAGVFAPIGLHPRGMLPVPS